MAIVLVALIGAATGGFAGFDWRDMRPVIARGFILGAGSAFYYVSLAAMTLADATAIYFALPLIVAALSGLMIREEVKPWRWIAAFIGFIGVLITIRPASSLFEPAAILTLIATCLYAAGNLFTRRIDRKVPPLVIAMFAGFGFLTVALLLALIFGTGNFVTSGASKPCLPHPRLGHAVPARLGPVGRVLASPPPPASSPMPKPTAKPRRASSRRLNIRR